MQKEFTHQNHNLPDLGKSFAKLKLQDAIAANRHDSLFAHAIRSAPYQDAVQAIIDQLADNPALTARIMGADVILQIVELYPTSLTLYDMWQLRTFGDICQEQPAGTEWNGQVPEYRKQQYDMLQEGYAS